jgi:hypothetical protein
MLYVCQYECVCVYYKAFRPMKCFYEGGKTTESLFILIYIKSLANFMVVKRGTLGLTARCDAK